MAVVKYHNGSSWVPISDGQQKIKYYNGSSWVVPQKVKYYSSGWQTAYVNDVSGPSGGVVYDAVWDEGFRGFRVYYNAASDPSGIVTAQLEYSNTLVAGGVWSAVANLTISSGAVAAGSADHVVSTTDRANRDYVFYRTRFVDSLGNVSTTTIQSFQPKPYGTFYADPSSNSLNVGWGTWSTGYGAWRTGISDVFSGWASSTTGFQWGFVFYGANAIPTRGYAPDSATVSISKSSSSGCGGVVTMGTHNYATRPTTPTLSAPNSFSSGIINQGGHETVSFSSNARSALGSNSNFGLVVDAGTTTVAPCGGGNTYRQTAPPGDTTYDTDPWRIYAYYTV